MRAQQQRSAARALHTAVLALGMFAVAGAHAVSISPVVVELSPAHRIASIAVTNPGDTPVTFQAQTLAWKQVNGADAHSESDALLVAPAIATIAAGGSQVFRVAMRAAPSGQEMAFRLVLEDITAAVQPAPGDATVNVRVNHSLPVFVAVAGDPHPRPRMGACRDTPRPGQGCVRIDNDGDRYLQVKDLVIDAGDFRQHVSVNARVLAGAWKEFTFQAPTAPSAAIRVSASTSAGPVSLNLPALD